MSPRKTPRRAVRDPVQVYLAPDDRKLLDSLAKTTGSPDHHRDRTSSRHAAHL
jgi:hypothetical protein